MNRLIAHILISTLLFVICTRISYAENISGASAAIKTDATDAGFDYRVENLKIFLAKFDSPLVPYATDFVTYADANGLDYRLVPSISGVESTFGKHIPLDSFNAYGWAGGEYQFASWTDSIATVSTTLKNKYIDKGAPTIAKIAKRYAPPSTTWGGNVKYFVGKIDTLPLNFDII